MSVFSRFKQVQMSYLILDRGALPGNVIISEKPILGIFKFRDDIAIDNGIETGNSTASVYVHPEDFENVDKIRGNGIRYGDEVYQITGVSEGRNFRTNQAEHYKLTLQTQAEIEESTDLKADDDYTIEDGGDNDESES